MWSTGGRERSSQFLKIVTSRQSLGTPAWRDKSKYRYLVLNYEIFQQANTGNNVKSFVGSSKVDFLVVDEIHYAKQRTVENISLRRQMVSLLSFLAAKDNPNFRILGIAHLV